METNKLILRMASWLDLALIHFVFAFRQIRSISFHFQSKTNEFNQAKSMPLWETKLKLNRN